MFLDHIDDPPHFHCAYEDTPQHVKNTNFQTDSMVFTINYDHLMEHTPDRTSKLYTADLLDTKKRIQ